ncbi:VOC family protein [Gracilibacillus salitolerans]|uniref:VOC family protein n=1 Tax=Gracilibacillus salitolerans TaxID=2663022 RepID=A0A5Q2TI66_9BACI|nr:VOC family protein [Gracilibacillus salitolerans]QGH33712.1 VOC family protein [Gracilibacillus salitolerans]
MNPLNNKITAVFIPVKNIEKARDWYCDLLDKEPHDDFPGGHLYVIELDGLNVVLDSKIYREETILKTPAFHFDTDNIEESYQYMESKGVELLSDIQFGHFFNFKDLDGNHMMVCER